MINSPKNQIFLHLRQSEKNILKYVYQHLKLLYACVPLPFIEEHEISLVVRPQHYDNDNLEKLTSTRKLQKYQVPPLYSWFQNQLFLHKPSVAGPQRLSSGQPLHRAEGVGRCKLHMIVRESYSSLETPENRTSRAPCVLL